MSINRYVIAVLAACALLLGGCSKDASDVAQRAEASAIPGSISGSPYQPDVVGAIRDAMHGPELEARMVDDETAIGLVDKWLPVPHDPRWVTKESPRVRALLLDAARLQELGSGISAEAMARNANALAGGDVTQVAQAMESAYADMYAPSNAESSDAGDAQFDSDLLRYWDARQKILALLQPVEARHRGLAELSALGLLYRDPAALIATRGLERKLTKADAERLTKARAVASALLQADGVMP
ncbi:hypothetical protein ACW0US_18065 [Xanthomonas euvesicatoria]